MAALRAHPAGTRVGVDYVRDRKPAAAQVKLPEATTLQIPVPPAPPAPPSPPAAPTAPAPPAASVAERRKVVIVGQDGKTRTWEGDADDAMPEWARNAAAANGQRIEKRVHVFVDQNGNTRRLEGVDAPAPPAPPAPPAAPAPPPPPPAPAGG